MNTITTRAITITSTMLSTRTINRTSRMIRTLSARMMARLGSSQDPPVGDRVSILVPTCGRQFGHHSRAPQLGLTDDPFAH